jgi:outer membrane protein OmpA-like peptidoglycan-associated protein
MRAVGVLATTALFATGALTFAPTSLAQQGYPQIVPAYQTVDMEHQDRKARLVRLAAIQGIASPEFYEYSVAPGEHRLADYPVSIPVLRVVFREQVFFDFNKDEVKPEATAVLDTIAQSLRLEPPDVTLFIAGHTDAVGGVNYNLELGLRRAKSVAVALAKLGIAQTQLYVVSFGKAVPIAGNDTDEGRARNRRVEFLFAARPEPIAAWLAKQRTITCAPNQTRKGDDCPVDLTFHVVSVDMGARRAAMDTRQATSPQEISAPAKSVAMANPQVSISFGSKSVDIDMRQKIFTVRAPE